MKTLIAAAGVLGLAAAAQAGGFAVDTQGARATGMATAVTSQIDDASAVYYNAAGVVHGKGLDIQLGDTILAPSISYQDANNQTTNSKTGPVPPPNLYATYGINDDFAVGLGLFSPYGLGSSWPSSWPGRYFSVDSSLATYFINPELAVRPFERLKLGVGLDFVRGVVQINRAVNFIDSDGTIQLGGGAWGTGANLGAQVEIIKNELSFGAHYRGAVPLNFSGNVHFNNQPPELATKIRDQAVTTTLNIPESLQLGLSYVPIKNLRVAFDLDYANWSTFDNLTINFDDSSLSQTQAKNWKATWAYHFGGEYSVNEQIRVRLGFVFDPSPSPADTITPDLPAFDIYDVSVGGGYKFGQFQADLGYQFVLLNTAKSTNPQFPGTYKGTVQVIGASLSYRM